LAEYAAVPRDCVFSLPADMTLVEGALVEPLANALHVLERCTPLEGKTGLVYGAGPIGLMVFWAAKRLGAGRLAVVDLNPNRLELMKSLGADLTLLASKETLIDTIVSWSGGDGVDFGVDAVGVPVCRRNTLACTARGATAVWIGLAGDVAEVDARDVVTREITIHGSYAYRKENFARAISLLAQKTFPVAEVVSECPLEEGQQIFEALTSTDSKLMKAVFRL
jgi:threonine dehydrogenase-like Zn-dependent dehydrogenase